MFHLRGKEAFSTPNIVTRIAFMKPLIVVAVCLSVIVLTSCIPQTETVEPVDTPTSRPLPITVKLLDVEGNPIGGAKVQIRGTKDYGEWGDDVYRLPACGDGKKITAWAPGYYINWIDCNLLNADYTLSLTKYEIKDWIYYFNFGMCL